MTIQNKTHRIHETNDCEMFQFFLKMLKANYLPQLSMKES